MSRSRSLLALLARCAVVGCVALAVLSIVLWIASSRRPVGIFSLGSGTDLRFVNGEARFRHFYDYDFAPPVPRDQWFATAVSRGWVLPPDRRGKVPAFGFSSGHVSGTSGPASPGPGGAISPVRYWLLHVPLWAAMLPGLLAGGWVAARWARNRQSQRRGFPVLTGSDASHDSSTQRAGLAAILKISRLICAAR